MFKIIFLFLISCFIINSPNCQLTRGNWLVGGGASYSRLQSSSAAAAQFKETSLQINPEVGYFLKDKFALGLSPSLAYGSNTVGNSNTVFSVGPFVRYYFLKVDDELNLFAQTSYNYGFITNNGPISQKLNTFSFSGGPVFFFNSVNRQHIRKERALDILSDVIRRRLSPSVFFAFYTA